MSSDAIFDATITVHDEVAALAAINEQSGSPHRSLAAAFDAVFGTGETLEDYGVERHGADEATTYSLYGTGTAVDEDVRALMGALASCATGSVTFREDATGSAWRFVIRDGSCQEETGRTRYAGDLPVVESEVAETYLDLSLDNSTAQAVGDEGGPLRFSVATFVTVPEAVVAKGVLAVTDYVVRVLREGSASVTHRVRVVGLR